ncbi:MAG: (2E,6E)-farnesyl diphosphate synthase [Candidatus Thiodiazotropha sp. (ex Gloverina cf. vestifex)]|nr:(2E,6E)-farnesyl diphosphate synthase [Candidatus Thiodiazotropha sp. (ex Gloverina cf. vestifex)]
MAMNQALSEFMQQCRERVESSLEHALPSSSMLPTRLHEAMRYSALSGGKRIRPTLVYATGQAVDVSSERLDSPAVAVELIHAYSLVHDDLPAMDDDDLRRNQPTCHKAYDEATAILVGDALQAQAFQALCCGNSMQTDAETRIKMLETLTRASGSRGMAGGQAIDLESVGKELNLAELEILHIHKTGALIRAAVHLATLLNPQIGQEKTQALDRYAKCVGLAFQIRDDILDVEGDTEILGKTQGKDSAQDKPTYPALLGLSGAREKAEELLSEALRCLGHFDDEADPLRWIAKYIIGRSR